LRATQHRHGASVRLSWNFVSRLTAEGKRRLAVRNKSVTPPGRRRTRWIPGARLVVYDRGGHLLVGHGEEVRREIADFLAASGIDRR
jgi:alkanesulfonate monooxygenase SsuD/methylene tetrahydromethanopterin reductase-like flavin-dependent oxidoreductase (luciferase family)